MRFHYISDLHLERALSRFPRLSYRANLTPLAHVPLFLAGDIGHVHDQKYGDFLQIVANLYKHVYLVSGNHEYDHLTSELEHQELDYKVSALTSKIGNITFLNRRRVELKKCWIAGCTLWSFNPSNPSERAQTHNERHRKDYLFLDKTIEDARAYKKPLIIMTHHLPSFKLILPQFARYSACNWASHSDELLRAPVKLWICGHSHICYDSKIDGVRVLMNSNTSEIVETSMFH